jgi:hypothetical protein
MHYGRPAFRRCSQSLERFGTVDPWGPNVVVSACGSRNHAVERESELERCRLEFERRSGGTVDLSYLANAACRALVEFYTTADVPWIKRVLADPSSNDSDPRVMNFDCTNYPMACEAHDGKPSVRECDFRFGLRYLPCDDKCTDYYDQDLGTTLATCGDAPSWGE